MTNKANFKDVPDPVTDIQVVFSNHDSLELEWAKPEDNNSPIIGYKVFITPHCSFEDGNGLKVLSE